MSQICDIDQINRTLLNSNLITVPLDQNDFGGDINNMTDSQVILFLRLIKLMNSVSRSLGRNSDLSYLNKSDILSSAYLLGLPSEFTHPLDVLFFLTSEFEGLCVDYQNIIHEPHLNDLITIYNKSQQANIDKQNVNSIINTLSQINNSDLAKPLINLQLTQKEIDNIILIEKNINQDINNRLLILLTRADITIQSLFWKQEQSLFPSDIWKYIRYIRNSIDNQVGNLRMEDIMNLKYHLLYRMYDNKFNTSAVTKVLKFIIPDVRDRGGRTNEVRPSKLDMDPNYNRRRNNQHYDNRNNPPNSYFNSNSATNAQNQSAPRKISYHGSDRYRGGNAKRR